MVDNMDFSMVEMMAALMALSKAGMMEKNLAVDLAVQLVALEG